MKKVFILVLSLIIMTTSALCLTSCKKDTGGQGDPITGELFPND